MSYNPHHWIDGEIITDQWMNHNEQGIQDNSEGLASEQARAINTESELRTAIQNEVTRATTAESEKVNTSAVGVSIATLVGGKVPSGQLPSYVDDVIEGYYYQEFFYDDSEHTFPIVPESGKIYVDIPTSNAYRWSGSQYVLVGGVESVSAGIGLTGGTITSSGTIKAKLKSETASALTAASRESVANREYPVGVDADGNLSVNVPWSAGSGTVTSVKTGAGLTGGEITSRGTIKAKLKSETPSSLTAAARGSTANREYPVGVDADGNLSVNVPWDASGSKRAFHGTCNTAAATAAKEVTLTNATGWQLEAGVIVGVKFANTNTASNVTINVNGSGAKSIYYNNAVQTGSSNAICGYANRTHYYMYDGTYWVFLHNGLVDGRWDADATCTTAAATAAKAANASYYVLRQHNRFTLRIQNANTARSALTLNVNNTGAKPLYINGSASSANNYTIPAGDYQVYYDGTNYYIRTDALITGSTTDGGGVKIGTSRATATNSTLYFIHS